MNTFPPKATITLTQGVPGGGKTSLLIEKIRKLLDKGAHPADIRAVSFTREAAQQIDGRLGLTDDKWRIGTTIHAEAYRAMQGQEGVVLLEQSDLKSFLESENIHGSSPQVDKYGAIQIAEDDSGHKMFRARSLMRATGLDLAAVNKHWQLGLSVAGIGMTLERIARYEQWKSAGTVDFEDVLDVKKIFCGARYVFIDEAQDLTPKQWSVVFKLTAAAEHIEIFRDINQSIYHWAGAMPRLLDHHLERHSYVERVDMHQSRRCGDDIAAMANRILRKFDDPENTGWHGTGRRSVIGAARNDHWREALHAFVETNHKLGRSILLNARTNYAMMTMLDEVRKHGIEVSTIKGEKVSEPWADTWLNFDTLKRGGSISSYGAKQIAKKSSFAGVPYDVPEYRWADVFGPNDYSWEMALNGLTLNERSTIAQRLRRTGSAKNDSNIALSTVHASKGAEADAVFYHSVMGTDQTSKLRSSKMLRAAELPVVYVAATRARHSLMVVKRPKAKDYLGACGVTGLAI